MDGVAKTAKLPLFIVAAMLAVVTVVVAVPKRPAVKVLDIRNKPSFINKLLLGICLLYHKPCGGKRQAEMYKW